MDVYSAQIEHRDTFDRELEQRADEALVHNYSSSMTEIAGAREALGTVLEWMGVDARVPFGCRDVDELLECTLSPRGIMFEEMDMHDDDWRKRSVYLLAQLEDGPYVAVRPSLMGYSYVDPATRSPKRLSKKIGLQPRGWALVPPFPEGTSSFFEWLVVVLRMVTLYDVLSIVAASALVYGLGLVAPRVNRWVLEGIVPQGVDGYSLLIMAAVMYLTAGFARLAVQTAKTFLLSNLRLRIAGQAEACVMGRILLLPQSYFADKSAGKVSKRLSNVRQVSDRMVNLVLNLGLTAVFSLGYIPQMMSFAPVLVVPALVMLVIKCLFLVVVAAVNERNETVRMQAEIDASGLVFSALRGAQKIRTMGAERRVYARWAGIYQRVLAYDLDQPFILKVEDELASFITSVTTLVLISFVVGGGLSRSDYVAFNASYALVVVAVVELFDSLRSVLLMRPLISQLNDLLGTPIEVSEGDEVLRTAHGSIQLSNVSFSYPGGLGTIDKMDLTIPAGAKVAFVGESGCGKSTLMKLILGIEKPASGTVFFDGHSLASLDIRSYRRHVGSVFQFSRLIPGTVRSNICFTPRAVTEEEAWDAAEKACIAEDLRAMPLGIDTEISESNSCGFSGGQRQRILIARAFATKPAVMILDEATSALDNITQKKVLDAVYAEKCTVLMVAHRLSTVMGCDRIFVMEGGHIVEEGTYDELIAENGAFAQLVRKQIL